MNYWIVESEVYSNTWFLFRENGLEIKIVVKGGDVLSSHHLELHEQKHFEINHLKQRDLISEVIPA